MSYLREAARSGLWFAAFKMATQMFSWVVTIAIARILAPEDYGLMAMASILTGYVSIFSELGLGSAIIQKKDLSAEDLSSAFWLSLMIGGVFAIVCLGLAYPTAYIFNEARIVPITQLISVLFIVGALMIVPYSLLSKEVRFKEIGLSQLLAVITASLSMLWMAQNNFGVWTLINGTIIQRSVLVILTFSMSKWRPMFHFRFSEAKPLLQFGLNVAGSQSLFYLFQKVDTFIIAKVFNAQFLGYYSFAMQIASIPTDKIVSIVQQVSYPVFGRYQDNLAKCREMYLQTTKYIALMVAPLFLGGSFFGSEIITALLGEKWVPITFLFKILCISQFVVSVTTINNIVHNAMGRPQWGLRYHLASFIIMPLSIFAASRYGFNALAIPWVTVYPAICIVWTWITLSKLEIPVTEYLAKIATPLIGTVCMIGGIKGVQSLLNAGDIAAGDLRIILAQEIVIGSIMYIAYLLFFEKKTLVELWSLRKG